MQKKLALGNYAVARGAFEAGVKVVSSYPGTPSTEITEYIAKYPEVDAEWASNEKVALEIAIGSAIGGARSLSCMKHVGLNVAADPLFTVSYTGVNAGLVIAVADDPGMHSSQNEQDSRYYALSAGIPMIEPADSEEARDFTKRAFSLSEEFDMPCLLRLTTRISHSQSYIKEEERQEVPLKPYSKDISKYVMMPSFAKNRHVDLEMRLNKLKSADINFDKIEYNSKKLGVVCSGVVYEYVKEALPKASVYKIGLIHPLNINKIAEFAKTVKELLVIEELEPYFENILKANGIKCHGKEIFGIQGELSVSLIKNKLFGEEIKKGEKFISRPPMLCAGCPHRTIFHVFNKLKLAVMGDIGCYTLGALPPLNAMDTCVCMGASIGMAAGMEKARGREFAKKCVAVIGDSTFVHSGMTGLVSAVYSRLNTTVVIADNSTTGMTGHQNHPATGRNIRNEETNTLELAKICEAAGARVTVVDAFDLIGFEKALKTELEADGVGVVIAKRICALIDKDKKKKFFINDKCKKCNACVKFGCPAIKKEINQSNGLESEVQRPSGLKVDGKVIIDKVLCVGCGVCTKVCKFDAIVEEKSI